MKTSFDENGILRIQAENSTEAYALKALALDLQTRAINAEWVIFDTNVEPAFPVSWVKGTASQQPCNQDLRHQGLSYPLTCARCGKGPCHNSGRDGY